MEFEIGRFVVALFVFPIAISPYLYIRLIKRESIKEFREKTVFSKFSQQLKVDEKVKIISKHGSYANMIVYGISIPLSGLASVVDLYPIPVIFSLCCWFPVGVKMINNYYVMIVLTDRAVYVYDHLRKKTNAYALETISSVTAISKIYWREVVINGARVQPHIEVDNAYELAETASALVANVIGCRQGTAK